MICMSFFFSISFFLSFFLSFFSFCAVWISLELRFIFANRYVIFLGRESDRANTYSPTLLFCDYAVLFAFDFRSRSIWCLFFTQCIYLFPENSGKVVAE